MPVGVAPPVAGSGSQAWGHTLDVDPYHGAAFLRPVVGDPPVAVEVVAVGHDLVAGQTHVTPVTRFQVFENQVPDVTASPTPTPSAAPTPVPTPSDSPAPLPSGGLLDTHEAYPEGADPATYIDPVDEGYSYAWMPRVRCRMTAVNGSKQFLHENLQNKPRHGAGAHERPAAGPLLRRGEGHPDPQLNLQPGRRPGHANLLPGPDQLRGGHD